VCVRACVCVCVSDVRVLCGSIMFKCKRQTDTTSGISQSLEMKME